MGEEEEMRRLRASRRGGNRDERERRVVKGIGGERANGCVCVLVQKLVAALTDVSTEGRGCWPRRWERLDRRLN